MNNNMNEQNNQGMNNTFQPNGQGQFVNNMGQPVNPMPMNNNMGQPVNPMPMNNNAGYTNYVPNNNVPQNNKTKKIITICVAVVAVIVVIIVLIGLLSKSTKSNISTPKAKKTLTCTAHHAAIGVVYDETYEYYINDGSASIKWITKIDLKRTEFEGDGDIDDWVNNRVEDSKSECNAMSGCKFEYDYSKGNYLETTFFLDGEATKEQVEGLTAEQIYEQQKEKHESGEIGFYNCN